MAVNYTKYNKVASTCGVIRNSVFWKLCYAICKNGVKWLFFNLFPSVINSFFHSYLPILFVQIFFDFIFYKQDKNNYIIHYSEIS
jgi:hypothetical protein